MVKKKIKRVAKFIGSKKVQAKMTLQPSTPTKKDTRGWEWNMPCCSGVLPPLTSAPSQPLPALLSLLTAALSPLLKLRPSSTPSNLPASRSAGHHTSSPAGLCSCNEPSNDSSITFTTTAPKAMDDVGDCSNLEKKGKLDILDGVDGNYHAVHLLFCLHLSLSHTLQPSVRCVKFIALGHAALGTELLNKCEAPPKVKKCPVCLTMIAT